MRADESGQQRPGREVAFTQPSWEVGRDAAVPLTFRVANRGREAATFEVRLESPDGRLDRHWFELAFPDVVEPGGVASGTVWVRVPGRALPEGGDCRLRLVVVDADSRRRATAECLLRVVARRAAASRPCVVFPEPPTFEIGDGGVNTTVKVANCGGAEVTVDLRFRHEDGWRFAVERTVAVKVGSGPVAVTVRLDASADGAPRLGDRISVEAVWNGEVVSVSTGRVQPLKPDFRRRVKRVATVAASLAVLAVAALAGVDGVASVEDPADAQPEEQRDPEPVPPPEGPDGPDDGDTDEPDDPGGDTGGTGVETDPAPPVPVVAPDEVHLGPVTPGGSAAAELTVTNEGEEPFGLTGVELADDPGFAVSDGCGEADVTADTPCSVIVTYAPESPGTDRTTLVISTDATDTPIRVPVVGTAVEGDGPTVESESDPDPDEPDPDEPEPDEPDPDEPEPDEPDPDEPEPHEPEPHEPDPDEPEPNESEPDEPELLLR